MPDVRDGPRPWKKLASEPAPHLILFRPRWDTLVNPRTGETMKRLVLETRDWVNVVALTARERRLVVVRQFRFGGGEVTIEIPGGVVDPGEAHADTAKRELREETGYTAQSWTYLGSCDPNPAFHDNRCHHWLAEDAELTDVQELDSGEDIVPGTMAVEEALALVRQGTIRHSLVIAALARVFDLRNADRAIGV